MEMHHKLRRDPNWHPNGCNLCGQVRLFAYLFAYTRRFGESRSRATRGRKKRAKSNSEKRNSPLCRRRFPTSSTSTSKKKTLTARPPSLGLPQRHRQLAGEVRRRRAVEEAFRGLSRGLRVGGPVVLVRQRQDAGELGSSSFFFLSFSFRQKTDQPPRPAHPLARRGAGHDGGGGGRQGLGQAEAGERGRGERAGAPGEEGPAGGLWRSRRRNAIRSATDDDDDDDASAADARRLLPSPAAAAAAAGAGRRRLLRRAATNDDAASSSSSAAAVAAATISSLDLFHRRSRSSCSLNETREAGRPGLPPARRVGQGRRLEGEDLLLEQEGQEQGQLEEARGGVKQEEERRGGEKGVRARARERERERETEREEARERVAVLSFSLSFCNTNSNPWLFSHF